MSLLTTLNELYAEGRYDEALAEAEQADAALLADPDYHNLVGLCQLGLEQYAEASSSLQKAWELSPDNGAIAFNLANVYEIQGRFTEAAVYYGLSRRFPSPDLVGIDLDRFGNRDDMLGQIENAVALSSARTFVLLSLSNWDDEGYAAFERGPQLARALARCGHTVHFFDPPKPLEPDAQEEPTPTLDGTGDTPLDASVALSLAGKIRRDGVDCYPTYLTPDGSLPWNLSALLAKVAPPDIGAVLILQHPTHLYLRDLSSYVTIYDRADVFTDPDCDDLSVDFRFADEDLMNRASFITCASSPLFIGCSAYPVRENAFHLSGATDAARVAAAALPAGLDAIPEPRILIAHPLNAWVDIPLMLEVVAGNPEAHFILPDDAALLSGQTLPPNLHCVGRQTRPALWGYMKGCHLGLLCYQTTLNRAVHLDPLALYDLVAAGRACVSTPIPDAVFQTRYVTVADTPEVFRHTIAALLSQPTPDKADEPPEDFNDDLPPRLRFLVNHSWEARAATLLDLLEGRTPDFIVRFDQLVSELQPVCERHPIVYAVRATAHFLDNPAAGVAILETLNEEFPCRYISGQLSLGYLLDGEAEPMREFVRRAQFADYMALQLEMRFRMKQNSVREACAAALLAIPSLAAARTVIGSIQDKNNRRLYEVYQLCRQGNFEAFQTLKPMFSPLYSWLARRASGDDPDGLSALLN